MNIPADLLPIQEPRLHKERHDYFYHNVVKPLLGDVIRLQSNGIPIDMSKVQEMKEELEVILKDVNTRISENDTIRRFQAVQAQKIADKYKTSVLDKQKPAMHYFKPYSNGNITHRNYLVNRVLHNQGRDDERQPGWSIKSVKADKRLMEDYTIQRMLTKEVSVIDLTALDAMADLAIERQKVANSKYETKASEVPDKLFKDFNPASATQKQALFEYLSIESEAVSKDTGLPKWDKEQISIVNKTTTNEDVKLFTKAFIEHSQAAIIRQNFITAFDNYVIDGVLYGNFKLFGAKSFRLTSNKPNLLNLPSTGSVFAKPLKKCLIAPPGHVVLTADFNALEDRVLAAITKDAGKTAIQVDPDLDGHCYNALGYFKSEVEAIIGSEGTHEEKTKRFYQQMESGNKELKAIRQKGKAVTFGLAYGAYPPKVAAAIKCSIEQAEEIFNSYHDELYTGVTDYRENYVLPTVKDTGTIHLGLGCYINSSNAKKDIRTLHNATIQFWSILTLIAINRMHQRIDEAGLAKKIKCIATIYDSIYYTVPADPKTIKWLNDNLVEVMGQDFLIDQTVPNEAGSEIGLNWADLFEIPEGASETTISKYLDVVLNKVLDTSIVNDKFVSKVSVDDVKEISEPFETIAEAVAWMKETKERLKAEND